MGNIADTFEYLDGGVANEIYDLLDGEDAASLSSGDIDGGPANATFDDEFDGGVALYINDEFDGGNANSTFDEIWDGGHVFNTGEFIINLNKPSAINSYGAARTNSAAVGIYLIDTSNNIFYEAFPFTRNGLYVMERDYENIKQIRLVFSGTYISRVGVGKSVNLRTAVPKEPTLISTAKPRVTLSGQSIEGLGGYNYWRISVDTRYKFDKDDFNNLIESFPVLSKGYPMFISFDTETKLPIDRMYGNDINQQSLSFESSINRPLYSRRWIFEERF
jgi:hypothetical protein